MNAFTSYGLTGRTEVIPPLSQSRQADMACQCLYMRKHILGGPLAESGAAARGTEVHEILATYINQLVETNRSTDLGFLDCMITAAGNEAREALERFRSNHAFDPETVLGTELHIPLDKSFNPILGASREGGNPGARAEKNAVYEGTLDLVLLPSITEAEIHDWKSYYQIIDPDTFQSKFYPLLLMCLNPSLQRVRFVLEFIRYGASRSVEYTREDVPWLKELAERERARQEQLHKMSAHGGENLKASPGRHCTWCPLLLNGCPVAKTNPYGHMTPEERLRLALWLQEAEKQNTMLLKDILVEKGRISCKDQNENEYVADFVPVEKKFYPFENTNAVLHEWFKAHPEDINLLSQLTVSGLSSPLKARKRAQLAGKLCQVADVRVNTELRIGRVKEE